jgi:xanthine/uracil permease
MCTNEATAPPRAGLVLPALILGAAVANLNLAVANVALPDIGKAFDASQTSLNLIAVGYSLGLATSVLYLGAIGDRYGRKLMLLLGVALSVPACLLAAWACGRDLVKERLELVVAVLVQQRDADSLLVGEALRRRDPREASADDDDVIAVFAHRPLHIQPPT